MSEHSKGGGGGGKGQPDKVHLGYVVDLENPTEESLQAIKNEIVERISRSVAEEGDRLKKVDPSMMRDTHDRHMSIHSSG